MTKHLLLPDEITSFQESYRGLEEQVKQAWKDIGEAAGPNCDWHDNFAFDDAQRVFGVLGDKFKQVEAILNNASVVTTIEPKSVVAVGKRITISVDGAEPKTYSIGGYQTPIKWRVSYDAPLIKPLLWHDVWEFVQYNLNGKEIEVEIINVENAVL